MSREETAAASSASKYFSAVSALDCIAPLDPALRGRRLLARALARTLLPANTGPLRYAFEELLGETAGSARRLLYDWFFYRHLESRSWTQVDTGSGRGSFADAQDVGAYLRRVRAESSSRRFTSVTISTDCGSCVSSRLPLNPCSSCAATHGVPLKHARLRASHRTITR